MYEGKNVVVGEFGVAEDIGENEVEVIGVEGELFLEFSADVSTVTGLANESWAFVKPLKFAYVLVRAGHLTLRRCSY